MGRWGHKRVTGETDRVKQKMREESEKKAFDQEHTSVRRRAWWKRVRVEKCGPNVGRRSKDIELVVLRGLACRTY